MTSRMVELLGWVLALSIGVALRWHQITHQIVADDEWHALAMLQRHGWGHIATHFGAFDHCIPLTLVLDALYGTVGLDEITVRILPLVCGSAAVAVLPLAVRGAIGPAAALTFALLLAISPLGIYFSRYARPYAIAMPLAFMAAVSLVRWYRSGARGAALLACSCTALAPWFHPGVLPFVIAPYAVVLAHALRARRVREVLWIGVFPAVALLVLLGPPFLCDAASVRAKMVGARASWATWAGSLSLFTGSAHAPVVLTALALAELGLLAIWRTQRLLVVTLLVASALQLTAVASSGALFLERGIVFARYALPLLPVLLMLLALGIVRIARRGGWSVRTLVPLGLCALLFVLGPVPAVYLRPNDWTSHGMFQYDYDLATNHLLEAVKPARVPHFYSGLAALPPGSVTIVEAPRVVAWQNNPYALYQILHRQRTLAGEVDGVLGASGLAFPRDDPQARFRTLVPVAEIEQLRARGIRYVVLHKDLARECPKMQIDHPTDLSALSELYRQAVGEPVFSDDLIDVFELRR